MSLGNSSILVHFGVGPDQLIRLEKESSRRIRIIAPTIVPPNEITSTE